MPFTENEILQQLDLAYNGIPNSYYPKGNKGDIKYNFFLDLEHGYFETGGSRIHLYSDSTRWAIVFEINGYNNRASNAQIELYYIGNCIEYIIDNYPERNYITNSKNIVIVAPEEFERIENKEGSEMENFEFIGQDTKEIKVKNNLVSFDNNFEHYEKMGIKFPEDENPNKLISFGSFIRFLNETNSTLISALEEEIKDQIPSDIPKLMKIEDFHFISAYDKTKPPSIQETYKLIAKILTTKDTAYWNPTMKPNNNWKNWESGNL